MNKLKDAMLAHEEEDKMSGSQRATFYANVPTKTVWPEKSNRERNKQFDKMHEYRRDARNIEW